MREILRKVLFTVIALFSITTVMADGLHVGYCDGQMATAATGTVAGMNGADATIQEAVFLTPEILQHLASCKITSVYAGLAEDASEYPETITAWVRADKEGDNLASGTVAAAEGWNTVALDKAVELKDYAEKGLWIGFSFKQSKKLKVIALLNEGKTVENTGWICKNDNWTDYSSKGVLPIEAVVEGEGLPQHDLVLTDAKLSPSIVELGGSAKVSVTVYNSALVSAVNPVINYDIMDGKVKGSYTVDGTIKYRESATVTFEVDAAAVTEECSGAMELEVAWADGTVDETPEDNATSLEVEFTNEIIYRKMLVEEATGSWCGFCVRGIVGLREMTEKYPDTFIGLAVHDGDEYVVDEYDSWIGNQIDGYPSCLVNRDGNVYDPSTEELEEVMEQMETVASLSVDPSADVVDGKLVFSADVKFAKNMDEADYNIVYTLVENKLPIRQSNYYSGGGYGPMGGFEDLGSHCDVVVDDVVRGVYPSPDGESMDLASVEKGKVYTTTLEGELPVYVDPANVYVVAFVADAATGEIMNAGKGAVTNLPDGIKDVTVSAVNSQLTTYNVSGQRVGNNFKGIMIKGSKKIVK